MVLLVALFSGSSDWPFEKWTIMAIKVVKKKVFTWRIRCDDKPFKQERNF
jgi:hypothetical protein